MREVDGLIKSGHCAVLMLNGEWRGGGGKRDWEGRLVRDGYYAGGASAKPDFS